VTPAQAAIDVRNAYEGHDHDRFNSSLARLVGMVGLGPAVEGMTLAQLEVRRQELHGQLARVNDRIEHLEREQSQRYRAESAAALKVEAARRAPLDPSDEAHPFG
jgi:hypothetical protein